MLSSKDVKCCVQGDTKFHSSIKKLLCLHRVKEDTELC